MSEFTRGELMTMIKINEQQRDIAKQRREYDVVEWHKNTLRDLYHKLKHAK